MSTALLLVDDHVAIAQALASAFRHAGFEPVEHVPDEALDPQGVLAVARRIGAAVALVDINLGRGRSGLAVISALVGAGVTVIALSAQEADELADQAIEAGAAAFLNKAESFHLIEERVGQAARGEPLMPESRRLEAVAAARAARAVGDARLRGFASLPPREGEVLAGLMRGRSPQHIADEQSISVRTVRKHIESVRMKLGVRSQLAAVALAQEVGWPPS